MKVAMLAFYCLLTASMAAENSSLAPEIFDSLPTKFDEWNSLPFSDEKARLDNLAIHWQHSPNMLIHVVIYAGKKACAREVEAR